MIAIAIVTLAASIVASVLTVVTLLRLAQALSTAEQRLYETVQSSLTRFVSPGQEGEPSPLAVLVDQCAIILAGRIMQQLKNTAAGVASGQARHDLAVAEQELAGQSPLLGTLAAILPKKLRNQLIRHPQMLGQLGLFGPRNGETPSEVSGSSVRERLGRS